MGKRLISSPLSRMALETSQPPTEWVQGAIFLDIKAARVKLTTCLNLVSRLKMSAAIPPLPPYMLYISHLLLKFGGDSVNNR
jgi:hypothetical protein